MRAGIGITVIIVHLSAGALWWLVLTPGFVPYVEDFEII